MKKGTRTTIKRILSITLALSICMTLLTSMARADEAPAGDPPVNIEIILPSATSDENSGTDLGDSLLVEDAGSGDVVYITEEDTTPAPVTAGVQEESEGQPVDESKAAEAEAGDAKGDGTAVDDETAAVEDTASSNPDEASAAQDENEDGEAAEQESSEEAGNPEEGEIIDPEEQPETGNLPVAENEIGDAEAEVVYSDKGVTSDGLDWELTKDAVTGKYTLTITFKNDSEGDSLNITEEDLAKVEQYAAEVSAALAEKYGTAWEWDSTAVPSGSEAVQKFQVFLTGNGNKDHTYRYDAEKLEQMDGEFTLEKVDENGNVITDSETTFQLWHINEITDPETSETVEVKMFCSYDPETNTYTFIPTEATIQTINGRIEILYAMMKDVVYFLQEVQPPVGYELDPNIHIIMEEDMWEAEDESFRNQFSYLGEFTEDENGRIGLDVKFVDVKSGAGDYISVVTPTTAPDPTSDPVPEDEPTTDITTDPEVTPDEIPDDTDTTPEVTPADEEPTPEPVLDEPKPTPVSVNDIPKTGDMMDGFILIAIASAIGLVAVSFCGRRRDGARN